MNSKQKWSKEETNILCQKWENTTAKSLSTILNRTVRAITTKAKRLKLKTDKHITSSKYTCNENFFEKINIINSYVAGFLSADGHINKTETKIQWKQSSDDKELLCRIKNLLEFTGPVSTYEDSDTTRKKKYIFCNLHINSKKLIRDLSYNYNICRNDKINHLQNPPIKLNEIEQLAFIIGLIDGDGCICIVKESYIEISLVADEEIIKWISNITKKYTLSKGTNISRQGILYKFKLSKNKAETLLRTLLSISELEGIRLHRKWDKADKWLKK